MSDDVIARTGIGDLRGLEKHGVLSFRGIRYGAPPTGEHRFRPPRPVEPWSGVVDALDWGPTAPQNAAGLEAMLGGGDSAQSEDCLFLNVWTPACDDRRRPVMVWIHGGAFETGAGSIPWYHGTKLAERGAVVVTINYRLGALGFLYLEGYDDRFTGSGNVGISDQVCALQWVHDHIAAFGGDPDNVTIFGESAGAMSVGTLLGVPTARGLFHKAILQSGAASNLHQPASATDVAERFCDAAGLGIDADALDAAVRLPVDQLLAAQAKVDRGVVGAQQLLAWQPVVDGELVPTPPLEQVEAGAVADVPIIVGTTLEEMRLFSVLEQAGGFDDDRLTRRLTRMLGDADPVDEAVACYRERLGPTASATDVWVAAATDHVFRIPAIRLAERQARHQPDTRMYLFTYRSPAFGGVLGACHALDVPFVFDQLDAGGAGMFVGPVTGRHRTLAGAMADAWVAFARTGKPVADGLPHWPAYDGDRRATLAFDVGACEVVDDPMADERRLWEGVGS